MKPSSPQLTHCTLTGVDEFIDVEDLALISAASPIVEWGVLYSPNRQGQPGRYPSIQFIEHVLRELPSSVKVALHICGQGVPKLIAGFHTERHLVDLVAQRSGRVQLNFNHARSPIDIDGLVGMMRSDYPATTFITQENNANRGIAHVLRHAFAELGCISNHAVLHDASGGRGLLPDAWPSPTTIACGYAGGLGPLTIDSELPKIHLAAGDFPFWIDMENRLRHIEPDSGTDRFGIDSCLVAINQVRAYMNSNMNREIAVA